MTFWELQTRKAFVLRLHFAFWCWRNFWDKKKASTKIQHKTRARLLFFFFQMHKHHQKHLDDNQRLNAYYTQKSSPILTEIILLKVTS